MAVVCPITTHGGTAQKARNALEVAVPPAFPPPLTKLHVFEDEESEPWTMPVSMAHFASIVLAVAQPAAVAVKYGELVEPLYGALNTLVTWTSAAEVAGATTSMIVRAARNTGPPSPKDRFERFSTRRRPPVLSLDMVPAAPGRALNVS